VGQETELIATLPPRLDLVGLAMRAGRKVVDKIVDALKLSQPRAFSSEVDTGSREENASKQESRASVLIQSEPIML
jgi:hypothetical protein